MSESIVGLNEMGLQTRLMIEDLLHKRFVPFTITDYAGDYKIITFDVGKRYFSTTLSSAESPTCVKC